MGTSLKISIPTLLRIKPKAIHKVGKYINTLGLSRVAVFWGEGIKDIYGETIDVALSTLDVDVDFEHTVTSIEVRDCFENSLKLGSGVQGIVAIGGGKAVDHCKYIAHIKQLPLIVVPTIISNDGIASSVASLTTDGVRKSHNVMVPTAIVVDTDVIRSAPKSFLYSGIGDLISKESAIHDWKLAYHHQKEYVDDFSVMIARNSYDAFVNYGNIDLDDFEYLRVIVNSLVISGIAMESAGNSRPASGSEHLISHALDRISKSPKGHGIQVGVASIITTYLQGGDYKRLVNILEKVGFVDYVSQNPFTLKEFEKAIKMSVNIKENFFTILSIEGMIDKALEFVRSNDVMKKMVR